MTENRIEKSTPIQGAQTTVPVGERPADLAKGDGKGVQATGGDKGSKKSNDYETSGRDRNASFANHHPENSGREGADNEKVSRRAEVKADSGAEPKDNVPSHEKPNRERATEKGIVPSNETKNHSQVAGTPEPDANGKKLRKTSKGEKGSRKPGTEVTKEERAVQTR